MFEIGDYAVCPGHGVGQIVDMEVKEIGEETLSFYMVKIIANGMTVMVPTNSKDGIRKLVSSDEINSVYQLLNDHDVKVDNSTWNRRYRDYMEKVKTGSLVEIADVLRSLYLLKNQKNLSFGIELSCECFIMGQNKCLFTNFLNNIGHGECLSRPSNT